MVQHCYRYKKGQHAIRTWCQTTQFCIPQHNWWQAISSYIQKDVATISQCIQWVLLEIHQYRVQILYKPRSEIFIVDWLSWQNHKEGKDELIEDMDIRVDAIQSTTDIPECMSILQLQHTMAQDEHPLMSKKYYNYRLAKHKRSASHRHKDEGENIVKTRYGRIVRKPDRLMYQ